MNAAMSVPVTTRMKKNNIAFIESNPLLAKKLDAIDFEMKIEVDPDKWNEKSLRKEIEACAIVGLIRLDGRASEWRTKVEKGGDAILKQAEQKFPKFYDKVKKEVIIGVKKRLKEIEEDKGDNRRGLKDGKTALQNMNKIDLDKIFSIPGTATKTAFETLSKELGKTDDPDGKLFATCGDAIDAARKNFDDDADDVASVIKMFEDTAQRIKRNKETGKELDAFAALIDKQKGTFQAMSKAIDAFDQNLDAAAVDAKSRKLTAADAKRKAGLFKSTSNFDRASKALKGVMSTLKTDFAKVERALK